MKENLVLCQTILSMEKNLIDIEVAISNKSMSIDTARKHIKQILLMTDSLDQQYDCSELTREIKSISKDIIEKTQIHYTSSTYVR